MHHRIDTIVKQLRQDIALHLDPESIHSACRSVGHTWRRCVLNPAAILHWFAIQVIHGNTALHHISLFSGRRFTATAYCQARRFLPLAVFHAVLRNLLKGLVPDTQTQGRWRGHRTWLVDGSSFSMPDTPELQAKFGQPGNQSPGCGFPVAKILALFHAGTGLLLDVTAAPLRTHDMSQVGGIHPTLQPGDVVAADRGLSSFAHLAMLSRRLVYAVFRVHQRQIVDFTPGRPHLRPGEKTTQKGLPRSRWLRGLGVVDQVVEWFKPVDAPEWMTAEEYAALPDSLVVRELRYDVGRPGFRTKSVTLVTTLLDAELYPLEALAELYGMRWRVELNLRHLKQTMKMDVLKCTTVEGVLKELAVYAIVYNLVCIVMIEAAKRQNVAVERISFIDALRWLMQAKPGDELPKLVVNPDRPDRVEPRVKKRRPKQFPLMTKPRAELRNDLMGQGVNA
jgi:hypothetical protein